MKSVDVQLKCQTIVLLIFMFVVLTIMNGKARPITVKKNQLWNPVRTYAAVRSDWVKISLVRVLVVPPG